MKKLSPKSLLILALLAVAALGFEGYHLAHAQTVPASEPPFGDFYPPLDTGSSPQTKSGSLSIGNVSQPLSLQLSPAGIQWVTSAGQVTSSIAYDVNLQGLRVTSGNYSSVLGYNWRSSGGALVSNEPIAVGASNPGSATDLSSGNFFVPDLAILNQNRSGGLNFYMNPIGSENYAGIGPVILSAGYFSTSSLLSQYNAPNGYLPNGDLPSFSGIFASASNGFMDLASDVTDISSLAGAGYANFRSGAFVRLYANGNVDILKGAMDKPAFANLVAGQMTENPLMDANATLNSVIVIWNNSATGLVEQSPSGNTDITNFVVNTDKSISAGNTTGQDLSGQLPIICPNGYYIDAIKFQANTLPDIHCTQMFQSF